MGVQATGGASASFSAGGNGASLDLAANLIASNRTSTGLDTVALAADVKAQGDASLAQAVSEKLSPVEQGEFASALGESGGSEEGVGAFFDGAIRGDFSDNQSWSKLAGQTVVGFIPVVGQIADARDTVAAIGQVVRGEEGGWLNLGAAAVGWIPGIGDAAKGAIRGGSNVAEAGTDALQAAAKHGDEAAEAATDVARQTRRFDDADAFNRAANDAQPNMRYEYGNYAYETDALGRVKTSEGTISLDAAGRNDPDLQTSIGHEGKKTDVGFHIIADRFGGQTNRLNVVPGNGKPTGDGLPNLNNGAYKQFENTVGKLAENPANTVEIRIEANYATGNASNRPDSFEASYRVNGGVWMTQNFVNK
ncbi:DNA/RNA non-specific endonuclease [Sphingomonas crocodyli]|uniref:Type VII secretion system protein EssD-like domain-containing protein n=1 Tax=Sphingomonas crocodyli TaxID=1979270 RepID=A0A437M6X7_9SPHN|nr:DNA/RNA non-specific endonuclease [Sphingomonas crocodyli]RVT93305.1 hypothetical protein EOD43_05310 [Sphingomonas crocodyli]